MVGEGGGWMNLFDLLLFVVFGGDWFVYEVEFYCIFVVEIVNGGVWYEGFCVGCCCYLEVVC